MCQRCADLVEEMARELNLPEETVVSALYEFTAFPFSDEATSSAQLREWAEARRAAA